MIAANSQWQLASASMSANCLRDSLSDAGDKPRAFGETDRRVILNVDTFKLMVAVKFHGPVELLQLIAETGFDKVDGAEINPSSRLSTAERTSDDLGAQEEDMGQTTISDARCIGSEDVRS